MADYKKGDSKNIIVGAAALFTADSVLTPAAVPAVIEDEAYTQTLTDASSTGITNVGYTNSGLELMFTPDFGEVKVDQILDVAKLFKQGMTVNLKTSFAEATLENLLFSLAAKTGDLALESLDASFAGQKVMNLSAGEIGECPVERSLIAVGPGTGDCEIGRGKERIYVAYRALSIEAVSVMAKRDAATEFAVSFRLLPEDTSSSYGKIVDRTVSLLS
jgi:hypothetical protein